MQSDEGEKLALSSAACAPRAAHRFEQQRQHILPRSSTLHIGSMEPLPRVQPGVEQGPTMVSAYVTHRVNVLPVGNVRRQSS